MLGRSTLTHWITCTAAGAALTVLPACEKNKAASTDTSSGPSETKSSTASTKSSTDVPKVEGSTTRDGDWKVNAPGRGVAYEVSSKAGTVKLSFGGTTLEGKPSDGGRTYVGRSGKPYVCKPLDRGFELMSEGKPTWKVELTEGGVSISSADKKMSITKAGDILAIKKGDEIIGKVESEGDKIKVTDQGNNTKYEGQDKLLAAWGVLLLKDIGQPMQRLIFTELLARGR